LRWPPDPCGFRRVIKANSPSDVDLKVKILKILDEQIAIGHESSRAFGVIASEGTG